MELLRRPAGPAARIEDLKGGFLMPGMIDAHAHVLGTKLVLGGGHTLFLANYPETEVSIGALVRFVDGTIAAGTSRFGDCTLVFGGAGDSPVSSAIPFQAIARAETRDGPPGVLDSGQRMPRETMLHAYSRNAARALDQLDGIGSIAPGKRADLVLVDRDVLTVPVAELRDAKVLWTRFGGRVVDEGGR